MAGRLSILMGAILAIGILGTFAVAGVVLIEGFKDVEDQELRDDMQRVQGAMAADLDVLDRTTKDWAHWDDAYAFVQGDHDGFADANIVAPSFDANDVAFMAFLDAAGDLVGGGTLVDGELAAAPAAFTDGSWAAMGLTPGDGPQERSAGLVRVDDRWYLLSARPILHSDESGPAVGTLVWGRAIDTVYQDSLAAKVGLPVVLSATSQPLTAFSKDELDWDNVRVEAVMPDVHGQPALAVTFTSHRPILQEGIASITFFFIASLAISLAAMAVGIMVIRQGVAGPVRALQQHIAALQTGRPAGETPGRHRRDEIGDLAVGFERLILQLDASIEQLRRSNEDLDEFSRVASHDLKGPMTTLQLNLALLTRSVPDDEQVQKQLARLQQSATRMVVRLDALLRLARSSSAALDLQPTAMDDVLREVLEDLQGAIHAEGAEVITQPMPVVHADRQQMAHLLQNLVSNAIKYHRPEEPPRIVIGGKAHGAMAHITVQDNGRGFSASDAKAMFMPFVRLAAASDQEGSGVGLATCRRIVQRHGGNLTAQGEPGKGATFTVELPLAQP